MGLKVEDHVTAWIMESVSISSLRVPTGIQVFATLAAAIVSSFLIFVTVEALEGSGMVCCC